LWEEQVEEKVFPPEDPEGVLLLDVSLCLRVEKE